MSPYLLSFRLPFFYVSPALIAPHDGKVDLDGRPRDVGVYEGSTIIILKLGSTGEVSILFLSPVMVHSFTEYTHLGDKVEGGGDYNYPRHASNREFGGLVRSETSAEALDR